MANYNSRGQEALLPYQAFNINNLGGETIHDDRHHNLAGTTAATDDPSRNYPLLLGARRETPDGRMWVYVQMTGAAAVLGSVLASNAVVGEDTVSSSSDLLIIETGGVDTTWVAGAFAGDYVYVDAGTGEGQCRRILQNTATALHLDRPLATALAVADSDITIMRPFHVRKVPAGITEVVAGVALAAITENYYGWMQVRGFCEHVLADDTATVAGGDLVADDGVAGTCTDVGTGAAHPDQYVFGTAYAANVSDTIPADLTHCALG